MNPSDQLLLDELRADRGRVARLPSDDLDAPVAACPGWDVTTLLVHTGRIHRWAAAHVTAPLDEEVRFPPRPAPDTDIMAWVVEGLDGLIDVLSAVDLDGRCGSFVGSVPRRWWLRRQTVETALHRWDAQHALGSAPDPVAAPVAAVGITEWCELQALRWPTITTELAGTIHLHATDGEGEWLIEARPGSFTWTEGHHKGDVAVRGTRSDLLLLLWARLDPDGTNPDRVELFGDPDLLRALLDATAM